MTTSLPSALAKKRILFVDDDRMLLDGLRGALRPHRREWEMRFATSAEGALAEIEACPPDAIVADLRMPGTDGARLLELTRDACPGAIRIVLSGHAESKLVARAAAVAHRLIAKPCDARELAEVIERSCALQEIAGRVELDHHPMGVSNLPALPRVSTALNHVLGSGTAGADDLARVVEQDTAISAKVLQLANSAYFGRRSSITSLSTAVAYIGVDLLRALVLETETFTAFPIDSPIAGFDLEALQRHCQAVARLACALLPTREGRDDAFASGLLHDIGLLVLASRNRTELEEIIAISRQRGEHISTVEIERLGATHGEIGAYLLGLWGLPPTVTEALARHQSGRWHDLPWGSITALYVANALVEEQEALHAHDPTPALALDVDYLSRAGVSGKLGEWRTLAAEAAPPQPQR